MTSEKKIYDAIVFDFDGTLVDSCNIKTWAFGKLFESYGKEIEKDVLAYHLKNEGVSRFVKFRYLKETLLGETYKTEDGNKLSQLYSKLVRDAVVQAPFLPFVLEFLEEVYQQIPLFVASGTPEAELRDIVLLRRMNRFFRGIYGSPDSKAKILQKVLRVNKLIPETVLMVGDALSDLEGSQIAGTGFVGILNGKSTPFTKSTPTLQNFNELKRLLKGKI